MTESSRHIQAVPEAKAAGRAKVEISFLVDLEKYAAFYGEEVNGETEQEALNELGMTLRHAFQADNGRMRSPWYRAVVGRAVPSVDGSSGE